MYLPASVIQQQKLIRVPTGRIVILKSAYFQNIARQCDAFHKVATREQLYAALQNTSIRYIVVVEDSNITEGELGDLAKDNGGRKCQEKTIFYIPKKKAGIPR